MKCISEERNVVLNLELRNYCPKNRTIIIIFLDNKVCIDIVPKQSKNRFEAN